jgi:hypothetical protein
MRRNRDAPPINGNYGERPCLFPVYFSGTSGFHSCVEKALAEPPGNLTLQFSTTMLLYLHESSGKR